MTQIAYPTSDITVGSWTNVGGPTSHWDCLNEVSYSDSDYIQANNLTANMCEVRVNSLTDPNSSATHTVHLRVQKQGTGTINLTVALYEGTTSITSRSITLTTGWVDQSFTLTQAEVDAISDYTNLRIRFTATCAAATRYVRVSWANVEVPDVSANIDETASAAKFDGITATNNVSIPDGSTVTKFAGITGTTNINGNESSSLPDFIAIQIAGNLTIDETLWEA